MKQLKLGLIGYSEGNGHPYSWSTIFNGYNPKFLRSCPFPVIRNYLSEQKFPDDAIPNAKVTHIWTQDKDVSQHIAQLSKIENVVNFYEDMIGKVDGILMPKDDFENHYTLSKPFIEAGLPIYIDKPLAVDKKTAKKIFDLEKHENQIFSCSAIYYAKELQIPLKEISCLGKLHYVDACIIKDWERYAVHIIEPILKIIGDQGKILKTTINHEQYTKIVNVFWESGLTTTFTALGKRIPAPITFRLFGEKGYKEINYKDHFYASKKALQKFVNIILKKEKPFPKDWTLKVIDILERGINHEQMLINNRRHWEGRLSAS